MLIRMKHIPALDGLRGIAVLLVIALHLHYVLPWHLPGGFIGVDVFFVLSGFLITTLIIERRDSLRAFYVRRARRLLPAIAALLIVAGIVGEPRGAILSAAFYFANWWGLDHHVNAISHLWSLSIEEQFYLAWPLVMLSRSRHLGWIALGLALASATWRAGLYGHVHFTRLYRGTDTHADGLLLGCALALFWPRLIAVRAACVRFAPLALVALLVLSATLQLDAAPNTWIWGLPAVNLIAAVLIAAAAEGWGRWGVLVPIGRWSYSLYLWHYPLFAWLRSPIAIPIAAIAALLSYATVERAFRAGAPSRPRLRLRRGTRPAHG
jgi:peptidoglycan/LPS O-acetylase OafA/YrhL